MVKREDENGYFVVTRIHREDLEAIGFNASNVDDETMERLAEKMHDDYLEQLYWTSMENIAESLGIPRMCNVG